MRPSISNSCVVTILRRSVPLRRLEIRVPAILGIRGCRSIRRDSASNAFPLTAPVDAVRCVSSVTTLASDRRIDVPSLFQRLADLGLRKLFFLRKIFASVMRLSVFRHKLRRFYVSRFPIEIEYLVFGPQKIFRMPMAFQTPRHALRLRMIDDRHMVDLTVTAKTTKSSVDVRAVIVKNIIGCAIDLHPIDRGACFHARPYWLQLRIIFLHPGVAGHAGLPVWQI